jgi:hypothetical protein
MLFQLKYHDSGKDKACTPSVGQWNMINKVIQFWLGTESSAFNNSMEP